MHVGVDVGLAEAEGLSLGVEVVGDVGVSLGVEVVGVVVVGVEVVGDTDGLVEGLDVGVSLGVGGNVVVSAGNLNTFEI